MLQLWITSKRPSFYFVCILPGGNPSVFHIFLQPPTGLLTRPVNHFLPVDLFFASLRQVIVSITMKSIVPGFFWRYVVLALNMWCISELLLPWNCSKNPTCTSQPSEHLSDLFVVKDTAPPPTILSGHLYFPRKSLNTLFLICFKVYMASYFESLQYCAVCIPLSRVVHFHFVQLPGSPVNPFGCATVQQTIHIKLNLQSLHLHAYWFQKTWRHKPLKVLCHLKGHQSVLQVPDGDFIQDAPLFVSWAQSDQQLIGSLRGLQRGHQGSDRNVKTKITGCNVLHVRKSV